MDNATEYADTLKVSIEEKVTALTALAVADNDDDAWAHAQEAVDEHPLEIVWQKGAPFEVVLAVGGPDARIVHDVRWNDWHLDVHWGGDNAVRRSEHITAMGEHFLSMVEEGE